MQEVWHATQRLVPLGTMVTYIIWDVPLRILRTFPLAVLPPGERARRSACPFPRRGTGRMSMSFHKTYVCTSMLWINIKQNKVIERNISEERSSKNTLSRKEGGSDRIFPAAIHCAPAGHAPRSVSVPMISRSGPATAEALWWLRSRGSRMDLAEGFETGLPYFHLLSPDLALSRGGSLHCSSCTALQRTNLQQFSLQGNLYCFYS